MDLKKLKHAIALAEERNFTKAAERVHITQSALSRSIQMLEAELDIRLFDRDLSSVALTPIGEEFIGRARELLLHARTVRREIELLRAVEIGDVSLGAGPFPAATFLPPVIAQLVREHPRVRVDVEINSWANLVDHLLEERIEFFVSDTRDLAGDRRFTITPLARQFGGFFCRKGHPLAHQRLKTPQPVTAYPLASVHLPDLIQRQLLAFFGKTADTEFLTSVACDKPEFIAHVALNSDAILMTTHAAVAEELRLGKLVQIEFRDAPPFYTDMGVVTLAGRSFSAGAAWIIEKMRVLANALDQPGGRPESRPSRRRE